MDSTIERMTVRLPAQLLAEARRAAEEHQTTLTALLETGLRLELRSLEQAPPPIDLPVCSASLNSSAFGWGLPGEAANWSAGGWDSWSDAHPEE